jgi:hypothetical protein
MMEEKKDYQGITMVELVIPAIVLFFFAAFINSIINTNLIAYAQMNVTSYALTGNALSAANNVNTAFSLSAIAPLIGAIFWITVIYVLLYKRDFLGKLLLGYFVLGAIAVGLFIGYVIVKSLPTIFDLIFVFLKLFVELSVKLLFAIPSWIYSFFNTTGGVMIEIPMWIYGVVVVSLPIAYFVGDRIQKLNNDGEKQ